MKETLKGLIMVNRFTFILITTLFFFTFTVNAAPNKALFTTYDIVTPFVLSQPIISANLIHNGNEELIAIGVDEKKQTWIAIYSINQESNRYQLIKKLSIPKKYFAYDVSEFDEAENTKVRRLYFLSKDDVARLSITPSTDDTNSINTSFVVEQKIISMYLVNSADFVNQIDFIKDINEDGIDDIYLSHFETLNLWLSQCCGHYHHQALPLPSFVEHDNKQVTFNQRALFFADYNLDRKKDIAWIKQGSIEYFAQSNEGLFLTTSQPIAINESIYGLNWWDIRESDGDSLDQSQLSHRNVEKISDVNGDGIVDLVVRFTQSSGVLDRVNDYEFYFGKTQHNQVKKSQVVSFSEQADTVVKAEGTLTGLNIVDINNDNKFEVMVSSFELSVTNIIGALISGGIDQNVLLFAINKDSQFSAKPIISKEVELRFSLTKGRSGQPMVQLADVNGDGLKDLVLSDDDDTINVYAGQEGKRQFAKKALKQELRLAKDGQFIQHYDINRDGKQDFIMSYTRLDEPKLINTFTVIIAN